MMKLLTDFSLANQSLSGLLEIQQQSVIMQTREKQNEISYRQIDDVPSGRRS
jgi:hypothetical protein